MQLLRVDLSLGKNFSAGQHFSEKVMLSSQLSGGRSAKQLWCPPLDPKSVDTKHKMQKMLWHVAFCVLNDNIVFCRDIHTKKKTLECTSWHSACWNAGICFWTCRCRVFASSLVWKCHKSAFRLEQIRFHWSSWWKLWGWTPTKSRVFNPHFFGSESPDQVLTRILDPRLKFTGWNNGQLSLTCSFCLPFAQVFCEKTQHNGSETEARKVHSEPH